MFFAQLSAHSPSSALRAADATAAFNGGNLDAWVVWDPYFAIAQRHYGARVVADYVWQSPKA